RDQTVDTRGVHISARESEPGAEDHHCGQGGPQRRGTVTGQKVDKLNCELDAHFSKGVELFNRGDFFAAHEEMEDAMNLLDDDTSDWDFYLGLLRASVANHKLAQHQIPSAIVHLKAALKFLAHYPDRHRGMRLREFRSAL